MNELLERLETRIAFLEQANTDLSDQVYRQERELDALRNRLVSLAERFEAASTANREWTTEEEKPPHY